MKPEALAAEEVVLLRSALLSYYDRFARDLPWRRDRDPYRVLVSEIMLQQTRVETVLGYYEPWLDRFPTVASLAAADDEEVLKAWEGLGYYRRARNLHRAARMIRERGAMPATREELQELPGVGEYTSGAVASIAFRSRVPAVDGNVRRVLARLFDEPHPKPAWLRCSAHELVDPSRPGDWNQAVMELGATVCTPRNPDCPVCPVADWCSAFSAGTQLERPVPREKRPVPSARFALAVVECGERVLVQKRPPDGLLGGLWAFPEARLDQGRESPGSVEPEAVARGIAAELGVDVRGTHARLEPVRHRFTHLDAIYLPVVLTLRGEAEEEAGEPRLPGEGVCEEGAGGRRLRWIHPVEDDSAALPTAQRKVLERWTKRRAVEEGK